MRRTIRSDSFQERSFTDRTVFDNQPSFAFLATRGPVGRRCERSTVKDLRSPSPRRFYIVQPPNMPAIMRTKPEPMVPPA